MGTSVFRSLPNFITLGRFLLVPAIIAMISAERWTEACIVFVIAGLSDGLDGFIAKTFDLRTEIGAYLDPLADKALIVSIYIALAIVRVLPPTIAIVVVARDLMIIGAFMISWTLQKPVQVRPLLISKLNTLVQLVCAALILGAKAFSFSTAFWLDPVLYLVAALSIASLAAYFNLWIRHMSI